MTREEEIIGLNHTVSGLNEMYLEAKEEIERLNIENKQLIEHITSQESKARSIVAMLFWEWKRKQRLYLKHKTRSEKIGWGLYEQANISNTLFSNAHSMLKEQQ